MQDWKLADQIARLENAKLENAGLENVGPENAGMKNAGPENTYRVLIIVYIKTSENAQCHILSLTSITISCSNFIAKKEKN